MADIKNIKTIEQEKNINPEEIKEKESGVEHALDLPEKTREQEFTQEKEIKPIEVEEQKGTKEIAGLSIAPPAKQAEEERKKQIEAILAKNLQNIFISMPADKQREFKIAGEKTAVEINNLLSGTKVKLKKIVDLIKKWLALIPGINKFFLDQESKIKADEMLKLKRERDK